MEVLMGCFFDDFFSQIDRGYLCARYRRQMLAEYISTVIAGCREDDGCQAACREAVLSAIRYHRHMKNDNNGVCLLGKHHDVLYVAAKVCYDWKLEDSDAVASLLGDMFDCEKTFERLVGGAIFGVKMCQMVSGWKSDFNNREENVKALAYFIEHSYKTKSTYLVRGEGERFVDVPLECCGGTLPIWASLQAERRDIFDLFISYGAKVDPSCDSAIHYAKRLSYHSSPSSLSDGGRDSLATLLRTVNILYSPTDLPKFLPDYVTSKTTPSLKHLCKLVLRQHLSEHFQLPHGLENLSLPSDLKNYVALLSD